MVFELGQKSHEFAGAGAWEAVRMVGEFALAFGPSGKPRKESGERVFAAVR
jgi:hypothetical protein